MREAPARPLAGPAVGSPLLRTPYLSVDLARLDANARSISSTLAARGVGWRPHVKSHRSPVLARRLLAAGAIGVTCAKTSEADLFASQVPSILLGNEVVDGAELARLAAMQRSCEVILAVDGAEQARRVAAAADAEGVTIPVVIEVDVGMGRAGVRSVEQARALATELAALPSLALRGVFGYEGHCLTLWPLERKAEAVRAALGKLTAAGDALRDMGVDVDVVTAGGTGTYALACEVPGVTELEAGGGCLMDVFYAEHCHVTGLEFALHLHATVTSRPEPHLAIVDAGFKSVGRTVLPRVVGVPGAEVAGLSAEHGQLRVAAAEDLPVGSHVTLVPGYGDETILLHRELLLAGGDAGDEVLPLDPRFLSR